MNWQKLLRARVRLKEPLKKHTTFKIGGPAKFFIEPKDYEDLKSLLKLKKRYKLPILVIGRGSNILASDKGLNCIVVRLSQPCFSGAILKNNYLEAGSGLDLNQLVRLSKKHGLSGLEFLVGIPGTVGGALVMNAGIPGENIGDLVENITVMDYNGNLKSLGKRSIKFGYRRSNLSKFIILGARLKLARESKRQIQCKIKEHLACRRVSQDLFWPSAGCVFKNPPKNSAGRLIDLCGLKGKRIGDAQVSLKHANFIVNRRCAKAGDVLKLMALVRKRVKNRFRLDLKPEIKIWQ